MGLSGSSMVQQRGEMKVVVGGTNPNPDLGKFKFDE
jgi:hypothetical protein